MKNYNMILIEKLQNCQHYHQVKMINMNILQLIILTEILPPDQNKMIKQGKFTYPF